MSAPIPAADDATQAGSILADLRASGDELAPAPEAAGISAPRRRVSPQTVILVVVLCASAGALYFMRKKGIQSGVTFTTPPVEKELEKVRGKVSADERRILAELARSTAMARSAPIKIEKNPFVLVGESAGGDGPAQGRQAADQERIQREQREQEIRSRLANVVLTSVMDGPTPIAYIGGRLVKVGDRVEDYFTVAQIHERCVDLIADNQTFTVCMTDRTPGSRPPPPRPGTPYPNPRR